MSWVTPITDRVLSDVTSPTPSGKGYFNVADWTRVNGNNIELRSILAADGYKDIVPNTLVTPTMTTIPTVTDINQLIENIERLRLAACLPSALISALPYDWLGGPNQDSPDYTDVNTWEENQLILHTAIPYAVSYRISCGVAAAGQSRMWQHRFR